MTLQEQSQTRIGFLGMGHMGSHEELSSLAQ
jgi:hypothetical protein